MERSYYCRIITTMKLSSKVQSLTDLIQPAVAACGVELWGIEFRPQGKRSLLRVYIDLPKNNDADDSANTAKSVSVDDCKKVSHQVSGLLDVHDPIAGEFVLEVSSPGWDRAFFSVEQMQAYIGSKIAVRLITAINSRRKYTGKLLQADSSMIKIEFVENQAKNSNQESSIVELSTSNIDKANLVFEE